MPQVALWGKGILYHKRFYNLFLTSLASIDSFFSWQNLLALESCGFEGYMKPFFIEMYEMSVLHTWLGWSTVRFLSKYGASHVRCEDHGEHVVARAWTEGKSQAREKADEEDEPYPHLPSEMLVKRWRAQILSSVST